MQHQRALFAALPRPCHRLFTLDSNSIIYSQLFCTIVVRNSRRRRLLWLPHNSCTIVYTHSHQFDVAIVREHATIHKFLPETFSSRIIAAYNNK
jgi:hypothetical protein